MQLIDNSMFALEINDGETVIVEDEDRSDDDNVILGVTSADKMLPMSVKTVDGLSLKSCNQWQSQVND
jgi:hypothetical protein